ncbi:MAG TPA: PadR family transcriptional regulator [Blastocatellia bacterium]|jgi:transcriptional regulator|nr:PadR family transcriptional regulator [Blastocatellia bacterium]
MPKIELLQGTLDMLVLKTLNRGAMHGYEIARSIQQTSDDALRVEEGSLYPSLYRMERKGWIKCEWGLSENNRKARYYELTKIGRKQLESERVYWDRLTEAVAKVMQSA